MREVTTTTTIISLSESGMTLSFLYDEDRKATFEHSPILGSLLSRKEWWPSSEESQKKGTTSTRTEKGAMRGRTGWRRIRERGGGGIGGDSRDYPPIRRFKGRVSR